MHWGDSLVGFGVGFLVGLTGVGGGAVMTPLLILTGRAHPIMAVGTDLVWAALTKAVGTAIHYQQKTVNLGVVRWLAIGSVPGSLLGVAVLREIRKHTTEQSLNGFVLRAVGVALILVALSMAGPTLAKVGPLAQRTKRWDPKTRARLTTLAGAIVGFLVSLTSVGSGSLVLASLVLLYPRTPFSQLIGADICHAVLLAVVAGVGHVWIGSVNYPLVIRLLMGSIPGIWLGTKLTVVLPEKILRPILATMLLGMGYKLL